MKRSCLATLGLISVGYGLPAAFVLNDWEPAPTTTTSLDYDFLSQLVNGLSPVEKNVVLSMISSQNKNEMGYATVPAAHTASASITASAGAATKTEENEIFTDIVANRGARQPNLI